MNGDTSIMTPRKMEVYNTDLTKMNSFMSIWLPLVGESSIVHVAGEPNKMLTVKTVDIMKDTVELSALTGQETEVNRMKTEEGKFEYTIQRNAVQFHNPDINKVDETRVGFQTQKQISKLFETEMANAAESNLWVMDEAAPTSGQQLFDAITDAYSKFVMRNDEADVDLAKESVKFCTSFGVDTKMLTIVAQGTSTRELMQKGFGDSYKEELVFNKTTLPESLKGKEGVLFVNRQAIELYLSKVPQLFKRGHNDEKGYEYFEFGYDLPAFNFLKDNDCGIAFLPIDLSGMSA